MRVFSYIYLCAVCSLQIVIGLLYSTSHIRPDLTEDKRYPHHMNSSLLYNFQGYVVLKVGMISHNYESHQICQLEQRDPDYLTSHCWDNFLRGFCRAVCRKKRIPDCYPMEHYPSVLLLDSTQPFCLHSYAKPIWFH